MRDPVLLAAVLEELGYLDEKKKMDEKDEVDYEERNGNNSKNSWEGEK